MAKSVVPASVTSSPVMASWPFVLLEHLDEFATLAWYLVADSLLVEETFSRTMAKLDSIVLEASMPAVAYSQLRYVFISQAIAVLSEVRRERSESALSRPTSLSGLPDLPRLAFLLRLVIRLPEAEVAKCLDISPSTVKELVTNAIERLSVTSPLSAATEWHAA